MLDPAEYPWEIFGDVWKERVGCRAKIIPIPERSDPRRRQYPWAGMKYKSREVVVKVFADPLFDLDNSHSDWSCVIDRRNLRWAAPGLPPDA